MHIIYVHYYYKLGNNHALKIAIPLQARRPDLIDNELLFFSWCRKHEGHLWEAFLNAIASWTVIGKRILYVIYIINNIIIN